MGAEGFSFEGKGAVGARLAVYRAVWRACRSVSVALGVVAAAVMLPAEILGVAFLTIGVAAATALGLYGGGDAARWTRGQVVTAAAAATAAITLVLGLTAVLGLSVLWVAVLLAATSPPAVHWYGVRLGTSTPIAPQRSTADLCRQWRDSYEALRKARTDNQRLRIVMERQLCLDELDRRDPEGLQAWLASSASAAGDPSRFLKSQ